jgi:hypothetical protein
VAAPSPHPIRLIVTDDLRRSRLTVFFRLLLAIPHFFWLGLFGAAAVFVGFLNWWATLFAGRSPRGLHNFLAGFVRYATQVEAYLLLAANPWPAFYVGDTTKSYPVDLEIDPPAPQNRAVTFFRLFLMLPAVLVALALSGGIGGYGGSYRTSGGVAGTAALLIWFAALVRGRAPRGLRDLAAWGAGYTAQLAGYFFLLTDRYPTSDPVVHLSLSAGAGPAAAPVDPEERLRALHELHAREPELSLQEAMARLEPVAPEGETPVQEPLPPMPARGVVRGDLRRSRLTVFFRLLLWLPHLVWSVLWSVVALVVALLSWFAALVTGRPPAPFARFLAAFVRYSVHQQAFLYLIGNPFPGFVGKPGSYPIDLEVGAGEKQRRFSIFFRFFLAFPALLITAAGGSVLGVAALLGWFYALVLGRMPEGLRNAGAWALAYSGQTYAYLFLLSGAYPFSSPKAVTWQP